MKLRPGLPALWRSPTSIQVGDGASLALRLDDISDAEHEIISALERAQTLPDLRRRARAAGQSERVADRLIELLREAGALAADEELVAAALPYHSRCRLRPDATAWSLLRPDGEGWHHIARRRDAVVAVQDLGSVGFTIARLLALAGVGRLVLLDRTLVAPGEDAAGPYGAADVGTPRASAAARLLHDCAPDIDTSLGEQDAQLTVLVNRNVADPVRARELMRRDAPHLAVTVRVTDATVGPLVHPGATACLRCLHLHRSDADPSWAAVATQLRARTRFVDRGPETLLGHAVSGLAAAQVLAVIDGLRPATEAATLTIALPDLVPERQEWPLHQDCGCAPHGLLPRTTDDACARA